jgi:diguanylate cyclase (GGDEF)-like protein/PAS domain S-box-containing protein
VIDPDAVLDALPDAVLVIDHEAHVLWGNAAAESLFGLTVEDARGLSGLDLVHPDDLQMAAMSMVSVQGKERGTPLELRIRARDGWRLVELIGAPCAHGITLVLRDLTERRRWEVAGDREALFRTLIQAAPSVTLLLDGDATVRSSSSGLARLLGIDQEWLEGRPLADLVADDHRVALDLAWSQLVEGGARNVSVDLVVRSGDGGGLPVTATLVDLLEDPTVEGVVATLHDISARASAEAEVRQSNSILSATLESIAEGILVVDLEGRVISHNSQFAQMWRLDADLVTHGDSDLVRSVARQLRDPEGFVARFEAVVARPEADSHDLLEFADGRVVERDSRPQRIDGQVVGRVWSFRDVTAHRVLQNELARQAFHDPLTGLANQALFRDRVRNALERVRRSGGRVAVLFVDLDNFKMVNDGLGHAAGDQLLIALTDRLRGAVRTADTVARLGGDEFAVLVEDVGADEVVAEVAERILRVLREPVLVATHQVTASASIGIVYGGAEDSVGELLRNADLAMYEAKAAGRGCARVFTPDMHDAAVHRLSVTSSLRGAAGRGELEVHYQPILEVDSGRVHSMEALVRWQHPEFGLLGPDLFVPVAEDSGLINEIGVHVLEVAVREAASWRCPDGVAPPAVAVNLSPRQLTDGKLHHRVAGILDRVGLDPDRLVLEITENALMADPDHAVSVLQAIRALGVRLAVDDFGTGYSSLATLQRFPLNLLKLDRTFVVDVLDEQRSSLALAIVQMAHTLGLTPIAEGVEDVERLDALRAMECELAQGFLFSRPMRPDDAAAHLAAGPVLLPGPGWERRSESAPAPLGRGA